MAQRPNFIDLGPTNSGPFYTGLATPRGLPSPRLNVAGEQLSGLSPLDMLANQSRMLAKQLKESTNRESRLPPLTVESAFNLPRPEFVRSASADNPSGPSTRPDVEVPDLRPMSIYPQLSNILRDERNRDSAPNRSMPNLALLVNFPPDKSQDDGSLRGRKVEELSRDFGARREQSPASIDREPRLQQSQDPSRPIETDHIGGFSGLNASSQGQASYFPLPRPSMESNPPRGHPRPSTESARSFQRPSMETSRKQSSERRFDGNLGGFDGRGLAPPRSPFAQRTPSIRSVSVDSEEDAPGSMNASFEARKMSTSSALSSPISPFVHPRSPSVCSDFSTNGSRLSRPTFNFSRPLSRASEQAFDLPSRQTSGDSAPSFMLADDTLHTPTSMHGDEFLDSGNGAPSYVYSRFSLPRGKMLQRNSKIFQDGQTEFHYEQHLEGGSNVRPYAGTPLIGPPSPPSRPSTSSLPRNYTAAAPDFAPRRSEEANTARFNRSLELSRGGPAESVSSGASTIKAKSQHSTATSSEGSAEYHVTKGVECHEKGSLNESTYHLRIAARQNHPTGMLLYALACRHGWGMRPNQREGVQWLRKAADMAILEVADDEHTVKGGKSVDFLESKTRKAQFALSIYELGVSHMNGWGIEQDKALALRCFEIAGSWGDGDALAEAGFCYAQGVGCKKNLKKSAKFYRAAEAKGISMVGNSW